MSFKQFLFLRYIDKQGIVPVSELDDFEQEMMKFFLRLHYVEALQDGTPYGNFTEYRRITQQGTAALSDRWRQCISTCLSVFAIVISCATFILSVLKLI